MPKIKHKDHAITSKILNLRLAVLLSNIIFQGIRYMSLGEKIYKISITLLFAFLVNIFLQNVVLSLVTGHFLNYIFNGQYYVVFRYLSSKRTMSKKDLEGFITLIERLNIFFTPKDVLIIGSFCRGEMSLTSDLDIRLYHDSGFLPSIKSYLMATTLRFYGLKRKFPIDIFCFSDLIFLDKISKKETPVNFMNNKDFLNKYPLSKNYKKQLKELII
jgi:L-malate glycosyltransferase